MPNSVQFSSCYVGPMSPQHDILRLQMEEKAFIYE